MWFQVIPLCTLNYILKKNQEEAPICNYGDSHEPHHEQKMTIYQVQLLNMVNLYWRHIYKVKLS